MGQNILMLPEVVGENCTPLLPSTTGSVSPGPGTQVQPLPVECQYAASALVGAKNEIAARKDKEQSNPAIVFMSISSEKFSKATVTEIFSLRTAVNCRTLQIGAIV
jgi:hypothetical protein